MTTHAGAQHLPEELIRDILRRIDVKSLIRSQCVSKQWKTLIKTPSFIAEHLRRQSPCLLFPGKTRRNLQLRLLDREMQAWEVQVQPSAFDLGSPRIVGSSNGLLCLQIDKGTRLSILFFWNPAIQELRMAPGVVGYCWLSVGFGFSPIINDYKVVIIRQAVHYIYTYRVEVYSLTSGSSSWKVVESKILEGIRLKSSSVTANGVVFWRVAKDDANMIVSFDLALEVFTLIPFPVVANCHMYIRLAVYENKLAMLIKGCSRENSKLSCIDLWVMDEGGEAGSYNERWSWTKKCSMSPSCCLHPITVWNNEIVCRVNEQGKPRIALFNITTSEFNMIDMHDSYMCIDYVESLVPVGGKKLYATFK